MSGGEPWSPEEQRQLVEWPRWWLTQEVDLYLAIEGLRPDVAGWRIDRHPAPPGVEWYWLVDRLSESLTVYLCTERSYEVAEMAGPGDIQHEALP